MSDHQPPSKHRFTEPQFREFIRGHRRYLADRWSERRGVWFPPMRPVSQDWTPKSIASEPTP